MSTRQKFEGREIAGTEYTVTGASVELGSVDGKHVGQTVYVVVEAVVDKVTYKAIKDSEKLVRVQGCKAVVSALVDRAMIADSIEMARMEIEAREGIQQLGFDDG